MRAMLKIKHKQNNKSIASIKPLGKLKLCFCNALPLGVLQSLFCLQFVILAVVSTRAVVVPAQL